MGWVLAAEMAPIAIFGIPAGALISRLGAKRTMLLSDAARGPLLLVIPILHHSGHLSFAALMGATFAIGTFASPYFASSRLVVPEVAGEDEQAVASVNAILSAANLATKVRWPTPVRLDSRRRYPAQGAAEPTLRPGGRGTGRAAASRLSPLPADGDRIR